MKKLFSDLRRKSQLAQQLISHGDWLEVMRKVQRNLSPVLDPLVEAFVLGRDAVTHTYWRWRSHFGRVPFDYSVPFTVAPVPKPDPLRKNIIWIMLDALRSDIFSEFLKRGGLADLAGDGVYFSRAFAQGSWTYPSVFSFLTGRYPFNCGVSKIMHEDGKLVSLCSDFDDSCPTIFGSLRQYGYQIGSILDGWGYTVRTTAGQHHREDRYFEENWGWIYGQDRRYLSLAELRDASLSYIHSAAQQGPFMLFVRSLYTHSPYRTIFKSPEYVINLSRRRWVFRIIEGFMRGLQRFEDVYLEALMAALAKANQLHNTIIIISSDHGEMFWNLEDDLHANPTDEEMWRHQLEPYNALIKVPLLIWGAHMRGVYSHRFRMMDIMPTLFEEIGIEYDSTQLDGISARRVEPRPLYADSAGYGFGGLAFQAEGSKFLMSKRIGSTSYDITEDEYESVKLRRDATGDLDELISFVQGVSRSEDIIVGHDDEQVLMKRLEALGYIG